MTGKAVKAIFNPNSDESTPEEITPMQRAAFKLLMDKALELHRRDSRKQRAASVGEGEE